MMHEVATLLAWFVYGCSLRPRRSRTVVLHRSSESVSSQAARCPVVTQTDRVVSPRDFSSRYVTCVDLETSAATLATHG